LPEINMWNCTSMAAMDESGSAIHTVEIRILRRVRNCPSFLSRDVSSSIALLMKTMNQFYKLFSSASFIWIFIPGFQRNEVTLWKAVRKVRNWLVNESGEKAGGAARILNAYADFQEWHYKRQLDAGFSEEDIQDYPTNELLEAMRQWIAQGRPV